MIDRPKINLSNLEYPGADHDRSWHQLVFPRNYNNPTPQSRYHLVVIGAGPAGLITAIAAAGLGAKVALIEQKGMGGDCLNWAVFHRKPYWNIHAEHPFQALMMPSHG